jgi:hypothetical protein
MNAILKYALCACTRHLYLYHSFRYIGTDVAAVHPNPFSEMLREPRRQHQHHQPSLSLNSPGRRRRTTHNRESGSVLSFEGELDGWIKNKDAGEGTGQVVGQAVEMDGAEWSAQLVVDRLRSGWSADGYGGDGGASEGGEGGEDGEDGGGRGGREDRERRERRSVVALLTTLYREHNPERIASIPQILDEYDGKWELLFTQLYEKYGISGAIPRFDEHGGGSLVDDGGAVVHVIPTHRIIRNVEAVQVLMTIMLEFVANKQGDEEMKARCQCLVLDALGNIFGDHVSNFPRIIDMHAVVVFVDMLPSLHGMVRRRLLTILYDVAAGAQCVRFSEVVKKKEREAKDMGISVVLCSEREERHGYQCRVVYTRFTVPHLINSPRIAFVYVCLLFRCRFRNSVR